jgi:hypothetical protein
MKNPISVKIEFIEQAKIKDREMGLAALVRMSVTMPE